MPIALLQQVCTPKSYSPPLSTMANEDAPIRKFFVAAIHLTTQCLAIQLPMHARLVNAQSKPINTLETQSKDTAMWIPWMLRNARHSSALNTLQLTTRAKNHSPARQKSRAANEKLANGSNAHPQRKLKAKDERTVTLAPIHQPLDELASELTQYSLSIRTPTHWRASQQHRQTLTLQLK